LIAPVTTATTNSTTASVGWPDHSAELAATQTASSIASRAGSPASSRRLAATNPRTCRHLAHEAQT
jgi:hypothetical protein